MSDTANFTEHILKVHDTTNQLVGWVMRTFRTRNRLPMLTLWKSLILPKLDYCSQLWNPYKKGHIQLLEGVQRRFMRRIKGISDLDYWEQLKKLSVYSLQRRRERYIIIYVWKILENLVPNLPNANALEIEDGGRRGRLCKENVVNLRLPKKLQNLRSSSFSVIGPLLFNAIPKELRDIKNVEVDIFKRELDRWLAKVPDEPQIRNYTAMRQAETNSLLDMACLAEPHQVGLWEEQSVRDAGGGCTQRPRD